jgi:hypothetical protein
MHDAGWEHVTISRHHNFQWRTLSNDRMERPEGYPWVHCLGGFAESHAKESFEWCLHFESVLFLSNRSDTKLGGSLSFAIDQRGTLFVDVETLAMWPGWWHHTPPHRRLPRETSTRDAHFPCATRQWLWRYTSERIWTGLYRPHETCTHVYVLANGDVTAELKSVIHVNRYAKVLVKKATQNDSTFWGYGRVDICQWTQTSTTKVTKTQLKSFDIWFNYSSSVTEMSSSK